MPETQEGTFSSPDVVPDDLLKFAVPFLRDQWLSGHVTPLLANVFLDALHYSDRQLGKGFFITSIWRSTGHDKALGGSGIHCAIPYRAIDIECLGEHSWADAETRQVADYVNHRWQYDPRRPSLVVALYAPHESASGPHIHFQVHPNTAEVS